MKNILFIGIVALALIGFQSCQDNQETVTTSKATLENNLKAAVSEVVSTTTNEISLQDLHGFCIEKYDGLGDDVMIEGMHGLGHFRIPHLSDCATVTISDSVYPKEIIVDYGTGCTDNHNHTISGKIIITISDTLKKPGAVKTVVTQDLLIDSVKVELNASYKNLGMNSDSNWVILSSSEQVVTLNDSTVINKISQDSIEWLSGYTTTTKQDDIFLKSGSGSININDSLAYSSNITTPLLYDRSCEFILSGVVELYKDGNSVIIDYGDGTCDNIATVTTNGTTEEINLQSHKFSQNGEFEKHRHGFGDHGHGHGDK